MSPPDSFKSAQDTDYEPDIELIEECERLHLFAGSEEGFDSRYHFPVPKKLLIVGNILSRSSINSARTFSCVPRFSFSHPIYSPPSLVWANIIRFVSGRILSFSS